MATKDGVLIVHGGAEPSTLDPALATVMVGLKLIMHLFEGLVIYHPVDAHPIPGVAERWEISPDGRTYTFHLRGSRWSNGDSVTAHDFVYAWRRVVDPMTASEYAYRLYEVEQAREVAIGLAFAARSVALEVKWLGTLAIPFGILKPGDQMRAHFAVFIECRDGRIASQRNYDCFDPW